MKRDVEKPEGERSHLNSSLLLQWDKTFTLVSLAPLMSGTLCDPYSSLTSNLFNELSAWAGGGWIEGTICSSHPISNYRHFREREKDIEA